MKEQLKLLVIGSGGREFAIAKKLQASPHVATVYCAPGNIGMIEIGVIPVNIAETDFAALIKFARDQQLDWTFVGPENGLCAGIVDYFQQAGLKIFGPNREAAQLEGSKEYALRFMNQYHVPTAKFATFTGRNEALAGLQDFGLPVVIKADGLAGGKGVVIAQTTKDAVTTLTRMFARGMDKVVLEEYLTGPEYSMFVVVQDDQYRILPMAQDHKRAYDNDRGPNTGGMGAYSPVPQLKDHDYQRMVDEVVKPTVHGLHDRGYHYHGVIYIGLMMTEDGPKVIEYNVRLGDPETQVILPRLTTDLASLIDANLNDQPMPEIETNEQAVLGVVLASQGYPQQPVHGQELGTFPAMAGISIDYANVAGQSTALQGAGGRLLMVIGENHSLTKAQQMVYKYLAHLNEPKCFYRHDIGNRALED